MRNSQCVIKEKCSGDYNWVSGVRGSANSRPPIKGRGTAYESVLAVVG